MDSSIILTSENLATGWVGVWEQQYLRWASRLELTSECSSQH